MLLFTLGGDKRWVFYLTIYKNATDIVFFESGTAEL